VKSKSETVRKSLSIPLLKNLNERFGGSAPVITMAFCLLCVVTPIVLCFVFVGPRTILEYAGKSKPYSLVLDPASYAALSENQNEDSRKIVSFGDSNYFYPPHRIPKSKKMQTYLTTLLYEELNESEGLSDFVISQRAFASAGMFDYYCMIYEALEYSPDLIIVPINWRSFGSDEWDSFGGEWMESSNWYHPELSALVPLRNEFVRDQEDPLKVKGISFAKQLEYKISLYTLYPIGMKAWALESAKSLFVALRENINSSAFAAEETEKQTADKKRGPLVVRDISIDYPMTIEDTNLSYQSLAPLAHVASKRGTKVLFYIWPIDQERFEKIGHLDKESLDKSKKLVAEAVDEDNIYFMDLSDLLEHKYFFDQNGHCVVEGRRKIAKALAPKVAEILNEGMAATE
jgi:hypothetical protein